MRKLILSVVFTVFFYLVQTCIMPYLTWGNAIVGSVLFAWLGIVIVSLDKRYAFCASAAIGLFMECTLHPVKGLYAVLYPAITMLFSIPFADMSEKKREKRRMAVDKRKRQDDKPALMRIPMCAVCMDALFHAILIAYGALNGNGFTFGHIMRAYASVFYTLVITLILMIPCRKAMDIHPGVRPFEKERGIL